MATKRGDTLLFYSGGTEHLFVVMNDPVFSLEHNAHSILVVNFSTVRPNVPHDKTCLLENGCHSFVQHPTYVVFGRADILNAERVAAQVDAGEITAHEPVDEKLFALLCSGFKKSRAVTPKTKRFISRCLGELK